MASRGNAALIRGTKTRLTSTLKSRMKINDWIADEKVRHANRLAELNGMLVTVNRRIKEDEEEIARLSGAPTEAEFNAGATGVGLEENR